MEFLIDDTRPIFVQIAERIGEDILADRLAEEEQAPSTNQFAALYQITQPQRPRASTCWSIKGSSTRSEAWACSWRPAARARLEKRRTEFFERTSCRCSRRRRS